MADLAQEVAKSVSDTIARPSVDAQQSAVVPITAAVMQEVSPRIDFLTNQEPWWQSHIVWAIILLGIQRFIAYFGWTIPAEYHGEVIDFFVKYSPLIVLGLMSKARWFATRPLFSRWFK